MTTETLMTDAATQQGTGTQTAEATTAATGADTQTQAAAETTATQQQATGGKSAETAKAEDGAKTENDADKPLGAPDKYEFKAPEGATFDTQVIEQFSEVAKELNLPQDAAQKMLDKVAPVLAARQAEQMQTARTEWAEAAKADKEFGGEHLNENLAVAKKALDTFGSPELRTLLDTSGLGNHPELIRMMVRAGKAISEDKVVTGGLGSTPDSPAQRMYPGMNP